MNQTLNTLLIIGLALFCGTTYVVKDGQKEMGRFDVEDGGSGEKEIQRKDFLPIPEKAEQEKSEKIKPAAETEKKTEEEQPRSLTVQGRLVDLLHLKPLAEGEIIFEDGVTSLKVAPSKESNFSVELPASAHTGWMVKVRPPEGYSDKVFLYQKDELEKMSFEERLRLRTANYIQHGIRSPVSDLKIALFPISLTPEEEIKYREIIEFEAAPPPLPADPARGEEIRKQSVLF